MFGVRSPVCNSTGKSGLRTRRFWQSARARAGIEKARLANSAEREGGREEGENVTSELNAKKCTTTTPRRDICRNFLTDVVFRLLSQGVVRRPRHYPALNGGIASFSMPSFYIAKYTTGPQGGVYIWNCTISLGKNLFQQAFPT